MRAEVFLNRVRCHPRLRGRRRLGIGPCPLEERDRIFLELMTSDRELKASREG